MKKDIGQQLGMSFKTSLHIYILKVNKSLPVSWFLDTMYFMSNLEVKMRCCTMFCYFILVSLEY